MKTALEIYQMTMDRLTAAQFAKDVEVAAQLICVPLHVEVPNGAMTFDTPEMVRLGLARYSEVYAFDTLSHLNREARSANFQADDCIVGYHTTEGLREDGSETKPFDTQMTLFKIGNRWCISRMKSTAEPSAWDYLTRRDQAPSGTSPNAYVDFATPEKNVLQHTLEVVSAAFLSGDADALISNVVLPLTYKFRDGAVQTFESESELLLDFELYMKDFAEKRVTDIVRQVSEAKMIEEDVIEGTYRTYVLSGAVPIVPPWQSRARIMRQGGKWRLGYVERGLGHFGPPSSKNAAS